MLIRPEKQAEIAAIRTVTTAAFRRESGVPPPETALVEELRASDAWLPAFSLVAMDADTPVGHVLGTRGWLGATAALALGPLSVHPDHQGRGVGQALMHTVLGAADALGEPFVALLGEPGYYARFGFRLAAEYKIAPPLPEWRPYFQIRALTAFLPALHGTFRYPTPFDRI